MYLGRWLVAGLVFLGMWLGAAEPRIMSWDEGLTWLQDPDAERSTGAALVVARMESRLVGLLRNGTVDTKGLPIIVLSDGEPVRNPMTGRLVEPAGLLRLYAGTVQANPAGCIIFLDEEGIPLPLVTIHHALHRNIPERLNVMFGYAQSGMSRRMSLEEYARIVGKGDLIMAMAGEIRDGTLQDPALAVMTYHARQLAAEEALIALHSSGEVLNTGAVAGRIFLITDRDDAPVFLAQAREIWSKLSMKQATGIARPPLTIIGPRDADYELLRLQGIEFEIATAPPGQVRRAPLPRMILSGGDGGDVVQIEGFVPGEVLGAILGLHIADLRPLHPDLPVGEMDYHPNWSAILQGNR